MEKVPLLKQNLIPGDDDVDDPCRTAGFQNEVSGLSYIRISGPTPLESVSLPTLR